MKIPKIRIDERSSLGIGEGARENFANWAYSSKRTIPQKIRNMFRDWVYYAFGMGVLSIIAYVGSGIVGSFVYTAIPVWVYIFCAMLGVFSVLVGLLGFILWISLESLARIWDFLRWSIVIAFS
jgi:hypothetical protein